MKKSQGTFVQNQKTYSELFKDPRWQKKRLKILERDNFRCRSCDDDKSTLHVHHFIYDNDCKPWEYDNDNLITFCDTCHEAWHYLASHKTIGFETFSLVTKLNDAMEMESINLFFEVLNKTNG